LAFSGVRLLLSSGAHRDIEHADSARRDGPFFIVTRLYTDINRAETVLTLRAEDVVAAEILTDGVRTDYVIGCGKSPQQR
jgi:hypothetical protein